MSHFPSFFYGTAWKEERTESLTYQALNAGFRAIDTANQRKHYYEEGAGLGIKKFLNLPGSLERKDVFLQTKFTYAMGQDHRKPYQEKDPLAKQVKDSFASSLSHLQTDFIDSYLLHGPWGPSLIRDKDLEVWAVMENLLESRLVHHLGISNVSPEQLATLCKEVSIKPTFVQNRCFAKFGWDKEVREICKSEGIFYQGFSLLTANLRELSSPLIQELAKKYKKSIPQVVFRFAHQLKMISLTGTTDLAHMREDLDIFNFELSDSEVFQMEFDAF
jgi:diketogulonate reductase-like aldo/keto reductase